MFIIPSLSLKYIFHHWKLVDPPLAASELRQMLSWGGHIDKCIAIKYLSITCHAFTMHATLNNWHFFGCSTLLDNLKLFIDSFSQFVELLFFSFYVASQIQFPLKIRLRLLIACLNSAAQFPVVLRFGCNSVLAHCLWAVSVKENYIILKFDMLF